jgi:RNA recognition motif-containing protein
MKLFNKRTVPTRAIFIRNINYNADINDIDIFLTNYLDNYDDIIMLKDRSNTFTGKIVIIFDNQELAIKAINKLNNVKFFNKKLKVTYAFKKYTESNNSYDKSDISLINLFNNNLNLT